MARTYVSMADIDEMLALAHALGCHGQVREIEPALRRHDAMAAPAVARRRASHMYVRLYIGELSELLKQTAQEAVLQVERPTAVTGTMTKFSAKHRASWAASRMSRFTTSRLPTAFTARSNTCLGCSLSR